MKMTYLMTRLVWKVFISSKPSRYPSCPPLCGHFSIQENAVGALSYKVKKCLRHFSPLTPTHGGIRGFLFVSSSYIIVL